MPRARPATWAMLNHSGPVLPMPRSTTRMQALAISSPTPLSRKNRVYSRRSPVGARGRKVPCRFMKNDEGGAAAPHGDRFGTHGRPAETQVEQVGQAEVEDGIDGADDAELGQLVDQVA